MEAAAAASTADEAEKGEQAFQLYANHLVEAIHELMKVEVEVRNREFVDRV